MQEARVTDPFHDAADPSADGRGPPELSRVGAPQAFSGAGEHRHQIPDAKRAVEQGPESAVASPRTSVEPEVHGQHERLAGGSPANPSISVEDQHLPIDGLRD